jgi:hypothetical protein
MVAGAAMRGVIGLALAAAAAALALVGLPAGMGQRGPGQPNWRSSPLRTTMGRSVI